MLSFKSFNIVVVTIQGLVSIYLYFWSRQITVQLLKSKANISLEFQLKVDKIL